MRRGDVIALFGTLGSGKTTFVKGICAELKVREMVSSPSFTIVNEYTGTFLVYHFDFYRLSTEWEILDIGYDDYLAGEGICIMEWAERAKSILPPKRIDVYLQDVPGHPNRRELKIQDSR